MVRYLRSYSYAIDPFILRRPFRGNLFEATRSMEHKDLLRRPVLNDHVSRGQGNRVITKAMVRYLRSYPYAIDPFILRRPFWGNLFEATGSMEHKDSLRHPVLDDHLSRGKATVKRTLGVVCELCVIFSSLFVLFMHWWSTFRFYFWAFILSCYCLTVKSAKI